MANFKAVLLLLLLLLLILLLLLLLLLLLRRSGLVCCQTGRVTGQALLIHYSAKISLTIQHVVSITVCCVRIFGSGRR